MLKKLTDKHDEIISLYVKAKLSIRQLAARYDVCNATIVRVLKENNIPRRDRKVRSKIKDAEVIKLYLEEKLSTRNIAVRYDVSDNTIRKILEENNIPRRAKHWRKGKYKWKQEIRDKIVEAIKEDPFRTRISIAEEFGIPKGTIYYIIADAGIWVPGLRKEYLEKTDSVNNDG